MNRIIAHQNARRGAALLIVLAFVVLLTAMVVAYFTRVTTDNQSAKISFVGSDADQLARSALDIVVGDLKQEISAGSSPTPAPPALPIYLPTAAANMIPRRSGVPTGAPEPIPNLIRRSLASDTIVSPGVPSRASAVNSTTDVSTNNRSIGLARWNKHYLLPRYITGTTIDYTPPSPLPAPFNPNPPVATGFTPPDWVLVTRAGPAVKAGIGSGSSALNNPAPANSNYVLGRYAFAVYDEGGLVDINVAGYPSNTTPAQVGRKGYISFADLTQLGPPQSPQVDRIVGWRNSATAQATPSPTIGAFPLWTFDAASATRYFNAVLSNSTGFLKVSNAVWPASPNARTDQAFASRQQLLQFRTDTNFTQNALQYLGTFSRELNRPTWKPSTPTGSTIDYAGQAENSTAINRDLATVRVSGVFTRADGTQAIVGEPLVKTRYALSKLNSLLNILGPTIQRDFGLAWDITNKRWSYIGASTTSTVQARVLTLDEVGLGKVLDASGNYLPTPVYREPNFFELLKSVILSGSVGLGSGAANTFLASEQKYYITGTTPSNLLSADYQIMQIGANIIDAWDQDNIPVFLNFAGNELAGIENLPYLSKLVFCARIPKSTGAQGPIDSWLVPSLWNPHQNGSAATSTGNRVRIALTGSPSYTAAFTVGLNPPYVTNPIVTIPTPSMDVAANGFMAATPPNDPTPGPLPPGPVGAVSSVADSTGPEKYYGFHFVFSTPPTSAQVNQSNTDNCYPDFAGSGSVELQVQLLDTTYKTYQKWSILPSPTHPLTAQGVKNNGDFSQTNKMVDPEYVALDPRTLRFGVWGTDANSQGGNVKKQASYGAEDSLDLGPPANRIEQITWSGPQGGGSPSKFTVAALPADLSLYATNGTASNHYVDLDNVQRRGDWTTDASGTGSKATIMYASAKTPPAGTYFDRPQILSAPFQSVAELGQVFRDQPWKTLNFTTTNSGDVGLLDAFTLQDVPATAGKFSLNTRQLAVVKAVLSQAALRIDGSSILTPTQATNVATDVVAITTVSPVLNKSDLIAQLATKASFTGLANKEARECVVRALSDASQTRTWNLMIDVISQSGRYPSTATSLANFVVEGEKRYWLHVAIDRFTGEVIDQQLEAVYE